MAVNAVMVKIKCLCKFNIKTKLKMKIKFKFKVYFRKLFKSMIFHKLNVKYRYLTGVYDQINLKEIIEIIHPK